MILQIHEAKWYIQSIKCWINRFLCKTRVGQVFRPRKEDVPMFQRSIILFFNKVLSWLSRKVENNEETPEETLFYKIHLK